MNYRTEHDTIRSIHIPSDKYWGAQTQRSSQNFQIKSSNGRILIKIIHALATIKKLLRKKATLK